MRSAFFIVVLVSSGSFAVKVKQSCPGPSAAMRNDTIYYDIGAQYIPAGRSVKDAFLFDTECGNLTVFILCTFASVNYTYEPDYANYKLMIRSYTHDVWNGTLTAKNWNFACQELKDCQNRLEINRNKVMLCTGAALVAISFIFILVISIRALTK